MKISKVTDYAALSRYRLKPKPRCLASPDGSPCKCHLVINFANSLDPDKAQQNVGPDLDTNCLTLKCYS